jgi:RHS repeat-associated protein
MRGNLKSARLRLLGLLLLFLITASGAFAFSAAKSHQGKPAVSVETALKAINFASENDISIDSEFSINLRQTINFNRNRYYSPALGRFVSKDPIGFNGDINLYRYAANNPLIYTDPTGKVPQIIVFTLIAHELMVLKITYDFYANNLYPVCEKLCPGERAYVSGLIPPLSGSKIIVYKPATDESSSDVFVEHGLLPFGDCAYGLAGCSGY